MKFSTRAVIAALLCAALATPVLAQDNFPSKPIRILVASAPGGLVDTMARLVAQRMADRLGQQVVVENKDGAATLIGIRAVKGAPADGYTLLATSNTITAIPSMYTDPGFDIFKDLTGVGPIARSPWLVLVSSKNPDKSLPEFVARAAAHPENFTFASGGVGTMPFLSAESFLRRAGLRIGHVPYRGNGAAMPDVIAGRVSMIFEAPGSGAGKVRGGLMKALGVTSEKRLPAFPEVPTLIEQGYANFTSYVYVGLFAPAATPKEVLKKISGALQGAMSSKEIREALERDGMEPMQATPEQFNESLKREVGEMSRLIGELGIPKN